MIVLLMGGALVLAAILIVGSVLGEESGDGKPGGVNRSLKVLEAMSVAPKELTQELDKPFAERVLEPLQRRTLGLGRRLSGRDSADRIRHKLDVAGNPPGWTVDRVLAGKVIGPFVVVFVALLFVGLLGIEGGLRTFILLAALVVGFFSPNLYLYQKGYERSAQLRNELADAIDLMTISVESGLGFDAALQQVAHNTDGPLSEELSRMLREMQIGASRSAALRGVAERTSVPELQTFVSAMVQADAFGIPVAQVLRVQSSEMRVKRRQRAEAKAQQVPVKITVPLIFCILPCLFIAVMGPAVINIMNGL